MSAVVARPLAVAVRLLMAAAAWSWGSEAGGVEADLVDHGLGFTRLCNDQQR